MRLRRIAAIAALTLAAAAAPAQAASRPDLAVTPDGIAYTAWLKPVRGIDVVQERRRDASGALSDAQYASQSSTPATPPVIRAAGPTGALITWIASHPGFEDIESVFTRTRSADGALGPLQNVTSTGAYDGRGPSATEVDVAVTPQGAALYVWNTGYRIQMRWRSAAGVLFPIQTVSDVPVAGSAEPRVVMDQAGNAVIAWRGPPTTHYPSPLYSRSRAAGGSGALTGGPFFAGTAGAFDLDGAPDGSVALAWEVPQGSTRVIRAQAAIPGLGSNPLKTLSAADGTSSAPTIAIQPGGRVHAGWTRAIDGGVAVEGRAGSLAGTMSSVFRLDAGAVAVDPQVAVDANGTGVYAWASDSFGADGRLVRARRRSAAGALGLKQTVSTPGFEAGAPRLGMDAAGGAVLVWTEKLGESRTVIRGRRRTAAGGLSAIQRLDQ